MVIIVIFFSAKTILDTLDNFYVSFNTCVEGIWNYMSTKQDYKTLEISLLHFLLLYSLAP